MLIIQAAVAWASSGVSFHGHSGAACPGAVNSAAEGRGWPAPPTRRKAKPAAAPPGAEYEVDSNRAGQVWAVRITDNGAVVVSRHATTAGPSGSFTVRKVIANRPGPDKIHARATFKNHTCGGAVTL